MDSARKAGIKKGFINGASMGTIFLVMFSTYGLGFWYGSRLVFDNEISVGNLLTSFFGVLIGSFSVGQVGQRSKFDKFVFFYCKKATNFLRH